NAIDLDHQQIEVGEIGCHPILHARRRQRYEAAGGGRFRQTSPRRPRNVSLRQPNRSGKLTRRDIDQHLVQGPFPEPVLRNCRLPTRYRLLLPVKAAKPWPLDFDLAAVDADSPISTSSGAIPRWIRVALVRSPGGAHQPRKDSSSTLSAISLAPRKAACRYTVSAEAPVLSGLQALIREVAGPCALQL